ncbi:unnamed protein product [Effrenium voratum]|nr:unnamed protein product [Effrenium voratum]
MVAARVLKIPYLSMFTMPGPGVLVRPDSVTCEWETSEVTRQAREEILAAYEVDILERGGLMEFYSPHGNLCTTVGPLFVPVASAMQKQRFDGFPWHCVGPLLPKDQPSRRRRVAHPLATAEDLPVEALAGGRPVVLLSLGTVATGFFWANRFGKQGSQNGLAEVEGRDFVRFVFRVAFEALAQEDILVVLVTGPQDDALEGMEDAPSNFVLRRAVQQLEVLPKCQAFITHGGANSVHEALSLGLPLAVVPMFGDQPVNAEKVAAVGAGISFFEPLKTLTPESLRRAVSQLLAKSSPFRSAAEDLQRQMAKAPGVKGAVDIILDAGKGAGPGAAAAAAASLSAGLGGA